MAHLVPILSCSSSSLFPFPSLSLLFGLRFRFSTLVRLCLFSVWRSNRREERPTQHSQLRQNKQTYQQLQPREEQTHKLHRHMLDIILIIYCTPFVCLVLSVCRYFVSICLPLFVACAFFTKPTFAFASRNPIRSGSSRVGVVQSSNRTESSGSIGQ